MHSLEEAQSWIDARMDDVYGSRVGTVADVYFDPADRVVHWMLVRIGPEEGRLVLVPVPYSIATQAHVWVPLTNALIKRAPEAPPGRGLTRDQELELCFHYGGLRRRSVALGQREPADLTAVPGETVVPFPPR